MTLMVIHLVGSASYFLGSDGFSVSRPPSMSKPRIESGLPRHSQERRLGLESSTGVHWFKKIGARVLVLLRFRKYTHDWNVCGYQSILAVLYGYRSY